MGFGDGCHNLGVIYFEAEGDKNLAKKYFGKSCELGNDEDCQINLQWPINLMHLPFWTLALWGPI